jgi:hypothetical protein
MSMAEMTAERRDELIEWVAKQVVKRGLSTPAIVFVEMSRPVSFLGSQAVHFFAPFINVAINSQLSSEIATVMEDRKNIDRLVDRIEELTLEEDKRQREWTAGEKARRAAERKAGRNVTPSGEAPKSGLMARVREFVKRK